MTVLGLKTDLDVSLSVEFFALVITKLRMVSPIGVLKFYHCKQIDLTVI